MLAGEGPPRRGREGGYLVQVPDQRQKTMALLRSPIGSLATGAALRGHAGLRERAWVASRAQLIEEAACQVQADVISAYHLLSAGLPAVRASRRLGIPLVTTVFGEIYSELERHTLRRADVATVVAASCRVLSCSRHCAMSLPLLGIDEDVQVLYYGVDLQQFAPGDRHGARSALGLPPDAPVATFVGRMTQEMGLGLLLEAVPALLRALPGMHVLVVGAKGELTPAAVQVARQHPDNITVRCDLPAGLLADAYRAANVVVVPSLNERACLGLAAIEAMASGVPVVATRAGGITEVVEDGVSGKIVQPQRAANLVDGIVHYLADAERAQRAGEAGRTRAASLFDQDVTCREMERILLASAA